MKNIFQISNLAREQKSLATPGLNGIYLTANMIIVVIVATTLHATTLFRADLKFSSFSLSSSFAEEELTFFDSMTSSHDRTLTLEDIAAYAEENKKEMR